MSKVLNIDSLQGQTIGRRYRLKMLRGLGNFGGVYESDQLLLGDPIRQIAVKIIDSPHCSQSDLRAQLNDALLVIRLTSQTEYAEGARHIVTVLDLGVAEELGNRPFIVMELLEGDIAREIGSEGVGASIDRTLAILKQTLTGLSVLHGAQTPVLHRDLKPANLLLDRSGTVKIGDFGLATTDSLSRAKGDLTCLAPESLRHNLFTMTSDVYSIGLIAWYLLTGSHPYAHQKGDASGDLAVARLLKAQETPWPALRSAIIQNDRLEIPLLQKWIDRCVATDPNHRYQSAMECLEGLRRIEQLRPDDTRLSIKDTVSDAWTHLQERRPDMALTCANAVLEMAPNNEPALIIKSRALCSPGVKDFDAAIALLQASLVQRVSRELLFALADCYTQKGNSPMAVALKERARRVEP